ncbi:hypothetical protein J2S47_000002 [Streptomyces griseoviridis]|uniref:Secreted protein n=1 Tax=Streptomyces griseoviridis TaxID=45398 RepID=A0ABT9L720_STRGD|nr:hypothetical protein [Streptomyces griseoviridis]
MVVSTDAVAVALRSAWTAPLAFSSAMSRAPGPGPGSGSGPGSWLPAVAAAVTRATRPRGPVQGQPRLTLWAGGVWAGWPVGGWGGSCCALLHPLLRACHRRLCPGGLPRPGRPRDGLARRAVAVCRHCLQRTPRPWRTGGGGPLPGRPVAWRKRAAACLEYPRGSARRPGRTWMVGGAGGGSGVVGWRSVVVGGEVIGDFGSRRLCEGAGRGGVGWCWRLGRGAFTAQVTPCRACLRSRRVKRSVRGGCAGLR